MTGYVVHYIGGGSVGTEPSSSTSTDITGLTGGATYAISVEATSQHLSGESEEMTISLSELTYRSVLAELYTYMYISGTLFCAAKNYEISIIFYTSLLCTCTYNIVSSHRASSSSIRCNGG